MIIGMIAGFISGAIIMIIAVLILLKSMKYSIYNSQAVPLILLGMGISMLSFLSRISFMRNLGQIILAAGLFIGYFGLRHRIKSNAPFIIFTITFLLEQILCYRFNIDLLRLTSAPNKYNFFPLTSLILPVILTMRASNKHIRRLKKINGNPVRG